jgi:hypothetical protein
MGKAYPVKTPLVVRSLNMNKDPFRPNDEGEFFWDIESSLEGG